MQDNDFPPIRKTKRLPEWFRQPFQLVRKHAGQAVPRGLNDLPAPDRRGGGYSSNEWITTPERSFGSNHVVFGGMMLPVSAMLMSCCIETG